MRSSSTGVRRRRQSVFIALAVPRAAAVMIEPRTVRIERVHGMAVLEHHHEVRDIDVFEMDRTPSASSQYQAQRAPVLTPTAPAHRSAGSAACPSTVTRGVGRCRPASIRLGAGISATPERDRGTAPRARARCRRGPSGRFGVRRLEDGVPRSARPSRRVPVDARTADDDAAVLLGSQLDWTRCMRSLFTPPIARGAMVNPWPADARRAARAL